MDRKLTYKIYANNGTTFKTILNDVTSDLHFSKKINGGLGELRIRVKRKINDFGYEDTLDYNYVVKVLLNDDDNTDEIVYFGYITGFEPVVNQSEEFVDIICLGNIAKLQNSFYHVAIFVPITETATAPEVIIEHIITNYTAAVTNALVAFTAGSIDATGTTVTYTYNKLKWLEAISKTAEFLPTGWYWYISANQLMYVKDSASSTQHKLVIGRDILSISGRKTIENVVNRYDLDNGYPTDDGRFLRTSYNDAGSQLAYDIIAEVQTDNEITIQADLTIKGNALLADNKDPFNSFNVVVGANYDLASIEPGHRVSIRNIDNTAHTTFPDNMKVVNIDYTPDRAVLTLSAMEKDITELARKVKKLSEQNIIQLINKNQTILKTISATDADNYIETTAESNIPRLDLYQDEAGTSKRRLSIQGDSIKFYDTTAVERGSFTGEADGVACVGNLLPTTANVYDLGTATYKWRHLRLDQTIYLDTNKEIKWNDDKYIKSDLTHLIINQHIVPSANDTYQCGTASNKWSDVQSVLIQGADYGFENNWWITESYKLDIEEKGLAVLNEDNELVMFIGEKNLYAKDVKDISKLKYTKRNVDERKKINK